MNNDPGRSADQRVWACKTRLGQCGSSKTPQTDFQKLSRLDIYQYGGRQHAR